jgi:hypothetical protein
VIFSGSYSPLEHCPKAMGRPGSSSRHEGHITRFCPGWSFLCPHRPTYGPTYLRYAVSPELAAIPNLRRR